MALDADIRDQAYQFFVQEALELLQSIEQGLLTLQEDHSVPHVHSLMRAAHSIKGGAASVGLTEIQAIAHRLEDVFRALYQDTTEIDFELEDLLLKAYDCLRSPLVAQIETGIHDGAAAMAEFEPVFAQLEVRLGDSLTAEADLPTAAELGVDMTQSIFATDVADGLERLRKVLADPEHQEVAGELRAQAEVFAGLGELLNLPGFTEIAQSAITALQANPQAAQTIGELVLEDFYSAQAAVLGGDRIQGGSPSPALVEYGRSANRPNNSLGLFDSDSGSLESIFGEPFPADEATVVDLSSPAPSPQFGVTQPSAIPDSDLAALEGFFGQPLPTDPVVDLPDTLESVIDDTPETAIEAIQQLFSQLPPATDLEPSDSIAPSAQPELSPTAASPAQPVGPAPVAAPASPGVRVDLVRLERLNNLVGELVIQENSLLLQNQQFQSIIQALMQRFNRFEDLTKNLRDWADRLTLGTQTLFSTPTTTNGSELGTDFDSLQMDSYSHLYTLAQTTVEEIAQIGEAMRDMTLLTQQSQQTFKQKQQTLKQVRNDLLWARMLPLGDILQRFPRMVRDLAGKKRKQVAVRLSGVNTLVDKAILEKLYDPLVHLVRNAFDHGIEPPETRQAQGKPSQGTIEIRAYHRGNQTYIEIRDDGQGINLEKVRQRAIALNLLPAAEAATVTKGQLFEYLFAPGFSTAAQVSDLSGRGVGLDAVRLQVRALKGSVTITSEPGEGTTFTLRLPLTLTIAKLLVFSANSNLMALPVDSLVAIITAPESEIQTLQGRQFYRWQGQMVPLYPHSQFAYYYPLARDKGDQLESTALPAKKVPLLLVSGGSQVIALEIDQLLTEQELVIKPFGGAIAPPSYLYGCTILGDGRLVPVVDGPALVAQWLQPATPVGSIAPTPSSPMAPQSASTILVVDDSLTMRQTLSLTLQKKGYRVVQARDGREALDQLQQEPGVRAVFCDIEMPQMNGFEFLSNCRRKYPSQSLPVIMLTSRSGEKHRQLAKQLGATDYLTKPYLEQELLKTLQNCLGQLTSLSS
jgi:chemotaxis family two-component system sensor histidine kinase/response regulator PixL